MYQKKYYLLWELFGSEPRKDADFTGMLAALTNVRGPSCNMFFFLIMVSNMWLLLIKKIVNTLYFGSFSFFMMLYVTFSN